MTSWLMLLMTHLSRCLSQRSSDVDGCCICRVMAAKCSLTQLMYRAALKELTWRFSSRKHHSCQTYRLLSCRSAAVCCEIKQISTDSQGNHCKMLTQTLRNLIMYSSTPQQGVRPGQAPELTRWEWEAFEKCTRVYLNKTTSESWPCDYTLGTLLNQLHLLLKNDFSLWTTHFPGVTNMTNNRTWRNTGNKSG